jgi:hypothetical protein
LALRASGRVHVGMHGDAGFPLCIVAVHSERGGGGQRGRAGISGWKESGQGLQRGAAEMMVKVGW